MGLSLITPRLIGLISLSCMTYNNFVLSTLEHSHFFSHKSLNLPSNEKKRISKLELTKNPKQDF